MDRLFDPSVLTLRKGELLPLPEAMGRAVAVFAGSVWLTEERDTKDFVLQAGDHHTVAHEGLAVIEALADSTLVVFGAPDARPSSERVQREAHAARNAAIAEAARGIARRLAAVPRLLWARA